MKKLTLWSFVLFAFIKQLLELLVCLQQVIVRIEDGLLRRLIIALRWSCVVVEDLLLRISGTIAESRKAVASTNQASKVVTHFC